ncbi:MAG: hypothetical protein ABFS56_28000 [Pseudomonadota bacterium]
MISPFKVENISMHLLLIIIAASLFVFLLLSVLTPQNKILEGIGSLENILPSFMKKKTSMASLLKAWVENTLTDKPELQTWLLSLSPEGLEVLTDKVEVFCTDMGMDLAWLLAPDAEVTPDLTQKTEELVIDYCNLCLKALQNQPSAAAG